MRAPYFPKQVRPTRAARLRIHVAVLAWATILLIVASLVVRLGRHGPSLSTATAAYRKAAAATTLGDILGPEENAR